MFKLSAFDGPDAIDFALAIDQVTTLAERQVFRDDQLRAACATIRRLMATHQMTAEGRNAAR